MVVYQYLGPFRPIVNHTAEVISSALLTFGIQPPREEYISDAFLLTLLTLLLTSIAITLFSTTWTGRDTRDAAVIVGISGEGDAPAVGKTALFKALRYGQQPKYGTTPSMVVNEGIFSPKQATPPLLVRWVDFPGHPRLRPKLSEYLRQARCVLFVADIGRFTAQARRDADLLHDVLTHPVVVKRATPVAIVLNKCDDATRPSISPVVVRTRLEAELERVRIAKAGTLRSAAVGSEENDQEEEPVALGFDNEAFSFDHTAGPVTFCNASATTGDVDQVISFVRQGFK